MTVREKNPQKDQEKEKESSLEKSEFPCRIKICKNPSCKFWLLPCVMVWWLTDGWEGAPPDFTARTTC